MVRPWLGMGAVKSGYQLLPRIENGVLPAADRPGTENVRLTRMVMFLAGALLLTAAAARCYALPSPNKSCDSVSRGFTCYPELSHSWGQYSAWFAVPSDVSVEPPPGCKVTFANVLSRHGGRDPTTSKTASYAALLAQIRNTSTSFPPAYAFLKTYNYTLGADLLTDFGRQEMINSGIHFTRRYRRLFAHDTPFVRSAGQDRVIESAQKWLEGVAQATQTSPGNIDVTIPEDAAQNNTLSHDSCPAFEDGVYSKIGSAAQKIYLDVFAPPIQKRVNAALGTNLTTTSILSLMDLCPFNTIATFPTTSSAPNPFCTLFSQLEWQQYDYYQSLGKYYGYGPGNPLGPTQGAGYVNELLARLTNQTVRDTTNTNRTLDADPKTFALGRRLYADFSHDNDITNILAALGLYNATVPLSNTTLTTPTTNATGAYSASWTVPFASRLYVEKLACRGQKEEFVRVVVNDRVQPMKFCGGDRWGRCALGAFVASQGFSQRGGLWGLCGK